MKVGKRKTIVTVMVLPSSSTVYK